MKRVRRDVPDKPKKYGRQLSILTGKPIPEPEPKKPKRMPKRMKGKGTIISRPWTHYSHY